MFLLLLKPVHGQVPFCSFGKFPLQTTRPRKRLQQRPEYELEKSRFLLGEIFCLGLHAHVSCNSAPVLRAGDRTFKAPKCPPCRLLLLLRWGRILHYDGTDSFVFILGSTSNISEKEKISQYCVFQKGYLNAWDFRFPAHPKTVSNSVFMLCINADSDSLLTLNEVLRFLPLIHLHDSASKTLEFLQWVEQWTQKHTSNPNPWKL